MDNSKLVKELNEVISRKIEYVKYWKRLYENSYRGKWKKIRLYRYNQEKESLSSLVKFREELLN